MRLLANRFQANRQFVRTLFDVDAKPVDKEKVLQSDKLWRNLCLFVALPSLIIAGAHTYIKEKEHMEHYKRPPFVKYDHMNIMKKPFPWGDGKHSFFFNPKINSCVDGYDDEE